MRSRRGLAVILISTDFEEVAHICHRALVFRDGRIVGELAGRGSHDRAPDPRRLAHAGAGARPEAGGEPMQSLKSNALEPTRLELERPAARASG